MNKKELEIIVHALHAISPTGGSSVTWRLANKIANENDIEIDNNQIGKFQITAHQEMEEYLNG